MDSVSSRGFINAPEIYTREQHPVSRRDIDPDALKIMRRLIQHGFKAYLVGGAVRDLLLHKQPKDSDIATDATPNRVKHLFRNSRVIGRRFKLVHIFCGEGKIIQVSTFRDVNDPPKNESEESDEDRSRSSELPRKVADDNKFGTEETDALRRDLTINGLFYDLSTLSIIDYVQGMRDLRARIVRVIGDPATRFAEDPVRMLRVLRHSARAGFRVDEACLVAILEHHALIKDAPAMRLYEEMKKDLCCGHFAAILKLLASCRLLSHLLPEFTRANAAILSDGSFLSAALHTSDELVRGDEPSSHSVVLAILALFGSDERSIEALDARSLAAIYEDEAALLVKLGRCFSHLAVPRKEREKIADLLRVWFRKTTGSSKRRGRSSVEQFELDLLFRALGQSVDLFEDPAATQSDDAQDGHAQDEDEDDSTPAPRRRRRSRRRSGPATKA